MRISHQFDAGNIHCLSLEDPQDIQLEIRKDNQSDFYQWFYFRLSEAKAVACHLKIGNAGDSAYPDGWKNYQAVASYDRKTWFRVPTTFDGKALTISVTPKADSIYFAYFAPYSMERHGDLVARMGQQSHMSLQVLGSTIDGRDIDMIQVGDPQPGKKSFWAIGRQHPGESMAEWWMEGFLEKLADRQDAWTRALLDNAVLYVVPNMNPDGSFRGHLRTNAIGKNLNREWKDSTKDGSPEVYWVLQKMEETGVDFCLDVHGDEALPYNFIAGAEGIPSWNDQRQRQLDTFKDLLKTITPDFQTEHGYPLAEPGQGNMTLCTNAVAEKFGALSMTLEMPFKDTAGTPHPDVGWSPLRCKRLGESCLQAMYQILPHL